MMAVLPFMSLNLDIKGRTCKFIVLNPSQLEQLRIKK
jgi:hypothetical protein